METNDLRKALEDIKEKITKTGPSIAAAQENAESAGQLGELIGQVPQKYDTAIARSIRICLNIADEHLGDIDAVCDKVRQAAEDALVDTSALPHAPTEEELRDIYREKSTNAAEKPAEEDKDQIVAMLFHALRMTRAGEDIKSMRRTKSGLSETAEIKYESGWTKYVDVTADSGIAMIIDICKAIM